MTTIALEQETNNYWNLIKDAGNEVKLTLIKRLSDALVPAIKETKRKKEVKAADFAGIWKDDEYLEPEEIISLIKSERQFSNNLMPV